MPVFKCTVKQSHSGRTGCALEKGMNIEIVLPAQFHSINSNFATDKIQDAFIAKYNIDLKSCGFIPISIFAVEKI